MSIYDVAALFKARVESVAIGLSQSRYLLEVLLVDIVSVSLDDAKYRDVLKPSLP